MAGVINARLLGCTADKRANISCVAPRTAGIPMLFAGGRASSKKRGPQGDGAVSFHCGTILWFLVHAGPGPSKPGAGRLAQSNIRRGKNYLLLFSPAHISQPKMASY